MDYKTLISNYEALKRQLEAAIKDEQEAQRMYGNLINAAMNVVMPALSRGVRTIREQEIQHEQTFKTMIVSLDKAISAAKKEEADKEREKREAALHRPKR